MKKTFAILFAVLLLGTVAFVLIAKSRTPVWQTGFEKPPGVLKKIEKEIEHLKDHPWAGSYFYARGRAGDELTLAPKNGFVTEQFHCKGRSYQHGTVDWDGNTIKLSFATAPPPDFPTEYKPIRWGERVYLLPADDVIRLCNAINARYEPREHIFDCPSRIFLREGDAEKKVTGKPELPEEFLPYLLDEPVDTTVVAIGDTRDNEDKTKKFVTVVMDKGKKDGLLPGMKLYVIKPEGNYNYSGLRLTKVEESQSEGEYEMWSDHDMPEIDWQFSTYPHWRREKERTGIAP